MKYTVAASLTLLLTTTLPASAQPRETITFWEFPGYAIRICWDPPTTDASRNGSLLGILPYPGEEASFPVAIASDDSSIQATLDANPQIVQQTGFDCAVQGGSINVIADEDAVTLQCFFQAGVQVLDVNGDGVSDGENSMGAGVDFTRTIPLL